MDVKDITILFLAEIKAWVAKQWTGVLYLEIHFSEGGVSGVYFTDKRKIK